ncbi:MAG: alpha/beta hydrolase [Bradyrhizobium sp.]|nr:alpha/beta hydrolase [Bradyrhizobium sp.]
MYFYFPGQYTWSAQFVMGLWAGGQFGEMHRWLAPLRDKEPDLDAWDQAWDGMANEQEEQAATDLGEGYRRSAGARYLRAAIYRFCGERQLPPGDAKTKSYQKAMDSFGKAKDLMPLPIERVEIDSPDGILPAYLIPANTGRPAPTVIYYSGFDVVKEMLYCFVREEFVARGINVLIVDTPGLGEPLRLRGVPSRPDYEVPTKAVCDYLETRKDLDASRIGIMGISLGGYYAPRGAAFEPRIKAVVCWGAIYDYGAIWQKRFATASKNISVPFFQLPWVMGTKTMEEALERVKLFTLADVLPKLTQPILIMHGDNDLSCPVEEAYKTFEAVGSKDKTLRIFTIEKGGAEHVQADEPDQARQLAADWFAQRLGTAPRV